MKITKKSIASTIVGLVIIAAVVGGVKYTKVQKANVTSVTPIVATSNAVPAVTK